MTTDKITKIKVKKTRRGHPRPKGIDEELAVSRRNKAVQQILETLECCISAMKLEGECEHVSIAASSASMNSPHLPFDLAEAVREVEVAAPDLLPVIRKARGVLRRPLREWV